MQQNVVGTDKRTCGVIALTVGLVYRVAGTVSLTDREAVTCHRATT